MFEVPSQQILTTDSVTLTVDAVVYYRVFDPIKAVIANMDYNEVMLSFFLSFSRYDKNETDVGCQRSRIFNTWWNSRHLPAGQFVGRKV